MLGAWSGVALPSVDYEDKRRVPYYIKSGTSMVAVHVTGAAAHVKAAHPHWSAAPIKSALMTTYTFKARSFYQFEFIVLNFYN